MKYVLVSGGIVSGLGKGVIASSTGVLLKSLGYRVTSIKIDPYLNWYYRHNNNNNNNNPHTHTHTHTHIITLSRSIFYFDPIRFDPIRSVKRLSDAIELQNDDEEMHHVADEYDRFGLESSRSLLPLPLPLPHPSSPSFSDQNFVPFSDAGTMSPFEHGEVFVLDDGGEVDLDLGNYERFVDITLTRNNNITTGKIYRSVIEKVFSLLFDHLLSQEHSSLIDL